MRADRLMKSQIRERYLVTLASGDSFDGLIVDADPTTLVLADAEQVAGDGSRVKVDGQIWLPRANVLYLQRPRA